MAKPVELEVGNWEGGRQNPAVLPTGVAKMVMPGPLQSSGARGVAEPDRIPGHPRLAIIEM